MTRRLTRELDKLKPGDEVDLRVYANGQTKTGEGEDRRRPMTLYESIGAPHADDERATLGLNLAMHRQLARHDRRVRDGVDDGGPAAKAGIEEGSRIASINGVDVRGRAPATTTRLVVQHVERAAASSAKCRSSKPATTSTLRVYYNGQYKNVKAEGGPRCAICRVATDR